ncbi:MAG: beta-ketoacyl-[acyl-carrier-protein] synthase family protein [Nitrospirota bacterium]
MGQPAYLNALGIVSALGVGKVETTRRLMAGDTLGMGKDENLLIGGTVLVGCVTAKTAIVPQEYPYHNSRNNELLLTAIDEIRDDIDNIISKYGAQRVGVVLGTSTSGIREGEKAIATYDRNGKLPDSFDYRMWEIGSPALFLSKYLDISGPSYVVSTACSSSAKALIAARNMLLAGLCDAVITGGVDSLCQLTVNGFNALESISSELMNPMSINRKGLNIGEGAAVFIMSREPAPIALLGAGEASDAYHFTAPDPKGVGATMAINDALTDSGIAKDDLCYLNLHGTATKKNDEMESNVIFRVLSPHIPSSSTKPLTGHTLGAAGAIEAAFCWLTISDYNTEGVLPPHIWDGKIDINLPTITLVEHGRKLQGPKYTMSNSFAFGGSNASLVVGEAR